MPWHAAGANFDFAEEDPAPQLLRMEVAPQAHPAAGGWRGQGDEGVRVLQLPLVKVDVRLGACALPIKPSAYGPLATLDDLRCVAIPLTLVPSGEDNLTFETGQLPNLLQSRIAELRALYCEVGVVGRVLRGQRVVPCCELRGRARRLVVQIGRGMSDPCRVAMDLPLHPIPRCLELCADIEQHPLAVRVQYIGGLQRGRGVALQQQETYRCR
mmetsp:Transcript_68237/g.197794  ORF Transcript_68237/g.197794 Transcript_68237/m.197794 type:complete len:213 (-) Transcript_68237:100-738(-)